MMADEVLPADYATLALCLSCAALAYLHSGAKVAGSLLIGLVLLFALADGGFALAIAVGTNLYLATLLAFEQRGAQLRRLRHMVQEG